MTFLQKISISPAKFSMTFLLIYTEISVYPANLHNFLHTYFRVPSTQSYTPKIFFRHPNFFPMYTISFTFTPTLLPGAPPTQLCPEAEYPLTTLSSAMILDMTFIC